ncbi:alkaline phosphatase family protein [Corallococcus macrosporus]|uniref:Alkaline phosphatase family protein n=1 Tax=Corallococcus macrosporus TaxID=35 RepID=A0ABS3DFQ1_9BACT|nr:alkaline phosphatase D family protein [Corallococcus macrosporus]MBN8230152.1 alkaline phosphatase family protein [Corallococcus macrosporus]
MELLLGPILYAKEQVTYDPQGEDTWSFFLNLFLRGTDPKQPLPMRLCFTDEQGAKVFTSEEARPAADFSWLQGHASGVVWRWEVILPRKSEARRLKYHFEDPAQPDRPFSFQPPALPKDQTLSYVFPKQPLVVDDVIVPAEGASPRIAFFSCNGSEDQKKDDQDSDESRGLWERMLDEHRSAPGHPRKPSGFQLLIGGGDQVYADSIRASMNEMKPIRKLSNTLREPVPNGFADRVMAEYVELYQEQWNGAQGIAPMLARVPGLFMWDDHDIFDGWGSYEDLQQTPWFQDIYSAAARAFEAFQIGHLESPKTPRLPDVGPWTPEQKRHYFQAMTFSSKDCDLDVVMLDLRSGRTSPPAKGKTKGRGNGEFPVMSEGQWKAFDDWREACCQRKTKKEGYKAHHILVVSSIPVVHLRFSKELESLAGRFTELRDDMLDQWESQIHRGERTRLIMDLFSLAKRSSASVTVLSGDVHLGAWGRIRSRHPEHQLDTQTAVGEAIIEQITSSPISNKPPDLLRFLGILAASKDSTENLHYFLQTELLPVGHDLYLRERNWLAIRVEPSRLDPPQPKLWARWVAEKSPLSMEVVVAPPRPLPLKKESPKADGLLPPDGTARPPLS